MRFVVLLATILSLLAGSTSAQKVSFTRDVLPILSDRCFQCHGPDSQARKANLRLDDKSSIFAQRENGAVVVPGAPDDSILVHRITATNDTVMPPHGSNLRLSANEKATLRRWITEGAEWTPHWVINQFHHPRFRGINCLPPVFISYHKRVDWARYEPVTASEPYRGTLACLGEEWVWIRVWSGPGWDEGRSRSAWAGMRGRVRPGLG